MAKRGRVGTAVLGYCVVSLAVSLPAEAQLPDGPGRDVVEKVCGTCHPASTAASIRLTWEGWEATIGDMVSRGAQGSDEELTAVLDYLATHFLGEADQPLNVNTATAIELESVLGLLRREAAALLARRDEVEAFASVDDLKDIPGVPFEKIEARKDWLTFGLRSVEGQASEE